MTLVIDCNMRLTSNIAFSGAHFYDLLSDVFGA